MSPPVWQRVPPRPKGHSHLAPPPGSTRQGAAPWQGFGWQGLFSSAQVGPEGRLDGGFKRHEAPHTTPCFPLSAWPALTKAARRALTVEHASLQCSAQRPSMAGAGQAGVVPTLSDARASGHSPLPSAKLQLLVVDVQQTDAAFQANANGGPLKHSANRRDSGSGSEASSILSQQIVTLT